MDQASEGPVHSHALEHPQHPRFARAYARAVDGMNRRGAAGHRRRILADLHGSVVEIGAGAGSSFALYPPAVTHVLALEPDDYLRNLAQQEAGRATVPVTVTAAVAEHIPAGTGSIDAVVASLVLCSVEDQAAVLTEIRRVLKPGGTLAYYEHVRSNRPLLAAVEDLLTPVWRRAAGGCHPNRDTLDAIKAAGFNIEDNQRFSFAPSALTPPMAHILGRATSPGLRN
jgi:ubiquinone/menaquinone biosynthesis C-methylase UbiE